MPEFKGFNGWIEIFKGGKQTDSTGRVHDGSALLDRAVATFNAAEHEPPAVIGHPADNAPAYGWVSGLKKEGDRLLAQFKDVVPEFGNMVQTGMFKKRSAAFYPDGRLRHVGFLGAMPPAVKGLADLKFEAGDNAITFEFGEESGPITQAYQRIRDWLIKDLNNMDFADDVDIPSTSTSSTPSITSTEKENPMPQPGTFNEADLQAAVTKAVTKAEDEARKRVEAEFAERDRKRAAEARKGEIKQFLKTGILIGKLLPAMVDAGLQEFMEALPAEAPIEFGEGKPAKTPYVWFREFMESLPKVVEFKEFASRDGDVGSGSAGDKLTVLVEKKLAERPELGYSAAFSEVQTEHPGLAVEYATEMRA